MNQRSKRIFRGLLVGTVTLFVVLFIGSGIGWLIVHITRGLNSSPVLSGEFVHPWNNHGATLYMTERQKYWVDTFDWLSGWFGFLWVLAFAVWVVFATLAKKRN